MKTIIPISVEEANTEVLEKITELVGKYNCSMQIDLYHDRGSSYMDDESESPAVAKQIQAIFNLLGKGGQPYFLIATQPNAA